ncbi:MAG TPA: glycosyltransferase family 4 protein [Anaerolineales bacterium]|nr:glycosyltransferase family 4 protein [Anaerolineales bacterium]
MRILIALTYYRPHYSGLTIYTERLARALAKRGHQVTVLTSQFDPELPKEETVHGVRVIRMPVLMRLSKGVIMPSIPFQAWQEIKKADVVNLHLPQLDAAPISVLARILGKPVALTYQCDLQLPKGFIHQLANFGSDAANAVSAAMANVIVTTSRDYAENSAFLMRHEPKIVPVTPPVVLPDVAPDFIEQTRQKYGIRPEDKVIGMVARLAAEKGVEYLVRALSTVLEKEPNARVLYAGQYQNVMGEEAYAAMLAPLIEELGDHWKFLGLIPDDELAAFYHLCDVVVLPSTNSTEAFGMVQVEAMTCGTPAVASDMPGVRQPVLQTGMGKLFALKDSASLAESLLEVLASPTAFQGDIPEITRQYAPDSTAQQYEDIFESLVGKA